MILDQFSEFANDGQYGGQQQGSDLFNTQAQMSAGPVNPNQMMAGNVDSRQMGSAIGEADSHPPYDPNNPALMR